MASFFIVLWSLAVLSVKGQTSEFDLPQWITNNPAFHHPAEIDSIITGNGSIVSEEKENSAWLIHLSDKRGYGVEIEIRNLSVNPDADNYVMIAGWPLMTKSFKQVKLFTGKFTKPQKLRISDTRSFIVLYCAAGNAKKSQMELAYKRYGVSYEKNNPPTERPVKKETLYEIQFKGRPPNDYLEAEFMTKFKEAVRSVAKRFCDRQTIPFRESIPMDEMILIQRISFCPFEWPERDICVSLQHSVFVSGTKIPGGIIMDYELTAEHLKQMWQETEHPEIKELGIEIFKLPDPTNTIFWWTIIVGAVIASSLIGIFVFWTLEKYSRGIRIKTEPAVFKPAKLKKAPKLKLNPHQTIPIFMFDNGAFDNKKFEEAALKPSNREILSNKTGEIKFGGSSHVPIKNYFGSLLFSDTKNSEDDEETVVEFRPKEKSKN